MGGNLPEGVGLGTEAVASRPAHMANRSLKLFGEGQQTLLSPSVWIKTCLAWSMKERNPEQSFSLPSSEVCLTTRSSLGARQERGETRVPTPRRHAFTGGPVTGVGAAALGSTVWLSGGLQSGRREGCPSPAPATPGV